MSLNAIDAPEPAGEPGRFVMLEDYDVTEPLQRVDAVTRHRRALEVGFHRLVDPDGTHAIDELTAWALRHRRWLPPSTQWPS